MVSESVTLLVYLKRHHLKVFFTSAVPGNVKFPLRASGPTAYKPVYVVYVHWGAHVPCETISFSMNENM
jgi:hypothetical protein